MLGMRHSHVRVAKVASNHFPDVRRSDLPGLFQLLQGKIFGQTEEHFHGSLAAPGGQALARAHITALDHVAGCLKQGRIELLFLQI